MTSFISNIVSEYFKFEEHNELSLLKSNVNFAHCVSINLKMSQGIALEIENVICNFRICMYSHFQHLVYNCYFVVTFLNNLSDLTISKFFHCVDFAHHRSRKRNRVS
jgi:hypothetical protein